MRLNPFEPRRDLVTLMKDEVMLDQLKPAVFAKLVNTEFEVCDDPAKVFALTLTEVVEQTKTERQEIFSFFFRGPLTPFLPQGTHKLKHNQLGEMYIFLVPVGQDKVGFQYEAGFNRLIQS